MEAAAQSAAVAKKLICLMCSCPARALVPAISPWRSCDNSERLSGSNGLLLSPHVDKLFDRHWISFDTGGALIWQHEAAGEALRCWGIEGANLIRPFSREQEEFLIAHRDALRH